MLETLWLSLSFLIHGFENPFAFALLIAGTALLVGQRDRRAAVLFFLSVGIALASNYALKLLFAVPRPDGALVEAANYAFPSSHAAVAAAAAVSLWLGLGRTLSRPWRGTAAAVAVLFVALVGASRLSLGVHALPDVAVGAVLGAGVAFAIHAFSRY